jgi:septal ring factor EnvC (AmiA/AmiB activator)
MSTTRATLLNFPALLRAGWAIERRAEELSAWSARLRTPGLERELSTAALDLAIRSHVEAEDRSHVAAAESAVLRTALADVHTALAATQATLADAHAKQTEADAMLADTQSALAAARAVLARADRRAAEYDAERVGLGQRISKLTDDLDVVVQNAAERGRLVDAMERTVTWRVRNRLLAFRPVAALARRRSRAE